MTKITTTYDIVNAKTADLVAFYNEHATKPVAKFADRKTAERRALELLKQLTEVDRSNRPANVPLVKSVGIPKAQKAQKLSADPDETREKMHEAQVRTWKDPDVRIARSERSAVSVDGEEYKSVREAFEALGLPMGQHIKFRGRLKEAGKLEDFGYEWEVIPLNY